jgi:type I restriction enzyme M protein
VLRRGGMVVTVMPHGVLFRGGAERDIRSGLLDEDLVDAVIGLGPNLFYGTGIPACLLVLRAPDAKPPERQGKVLFINADREYREGRAQNYLDPEHIEKIVSTWEAFADVDGFARVVDRDELRENDDNLNIRRYADNSPPPEPHDVRAHLHGGVPKAEVEAKAALFAAHGLVPEHLFVERDERYFDFDPELTAKADLVPRIEGDDGVRWQQERLDTAVNGWWEESRAGVAALPETGGLMPLRARLLASFEAALRPVGLLDRFQVAGVVASWWGEVESDLRTLAARGSLGLVEAWETSIVTAMEDEKSKENPFDHRLVRRLLPEYLERVGDLEARKAELNAVVKAANGEEDEEEGDDGEDGEVLSEEELKAKKKELSALRKEIRRLRKEFVDRLQAARRELDEAGARELLLGILCAELDAILRRYVAEQRRDVVAAFEDWWEKYAVTLREIDQARHVSTQTLDRYLRQLQYGE